MTTVLVRHFVTFQITRVDEHLARRFHESKKLRDREISINFFLFKTKHSARLSFRPDYRLTFLAHASLYSRAATDCHVDQRSEAFPDISRIPDVAARRLRLTDCRCVYMRTFHVNSLFGRRSCF